MTLGNSEFKPLLTQNPVKWLQNLKIRKRLRHWLSRITNTFARYIDKFGFHWFFKYLWLRIMLLNLIGLIVMVAGVYFFSGFRASLLDMKVKDLTKDGEIIAAVISASNASGKRNDDSFDIDTLLFLYKDDKNTKKLGKQFAEVRFDLNPQKIEPLLQETVELTNTRARVYEPDGSLLVDSNIFLPRGQVIRALTPKQETNSPPHKGVLSEFMQYLMKLFRYAQLPLYEDIGGANGKAYSEVKIALTGQKSTIIRVNKDSQTIVSVATPIKIGKRVSGVLLLTTKGVEIDEAVQTARNVIITVAIVALIVSLTVSIYLTVTIATPMRHLSKAMKSIKQSNKKIHEIPDLSHRPDEIGQLSGALREMTLALHQRIEAIESFAADVSHELKNPLTSLQSAVETLPLAKRTEDRDHLIEVVLNDVSRLNRLITDIASASRLDAELARADKAPINMVSMLKSIAEIFNDVHCKKGARITVEFSPLMEDSNIFIVQGHDSRLAQVFTNLLDNALSFTPSNGTVWIRITRVDADIRITVEDEGPGIPEDNLDRIFARFYTDRPGENAFRENSGLGLNISQEIVKAHKGKIWAENRYGDSKTEDNVKQRIGARFVITLPADHPLGRRQK